MFFFCGFFRVGGRVDSSEINEQELKRKEHIKTIKVAIEDFSLPPVDYLKPEPIEDVKELYLKRLTLIMMQIKG